jgi:exodeoxyribonuclease-3
VSAQRLTVATWNVNGLRARVDRVGAWLDAFTPDVVLLQETKCNPEQVPAELFVSRGYAWCAYGAGGRNGVLIASRVGLEPSDDRLASAAAPAGEVDLLIEPRFISATCAGLRVASIYAPHGREVDSPYWHEKLRWFGALRDWSASRLTGADPLIIGGDFNVAPTDADVWDPAVLAGGTHVSEQERAAFAALTGLGLADAAVALATPEERAPYTWWDYRNGAFHRGWGMRIDQILVDPRAGRLVASSVDREGRKGASPSDHAALQITIERSAATA